MLTVAPAVIDKRGCNELKTSLLPGASTGLPREPSLPPSVQDRLAQSELGQVGRTKGWARDQTTLQNLQSSQTYTWVHSLDKGMENSSQGQAPCQVLGIRG